MLTADSGLSSYPAISRDGSLLVFASDRGGEGGLDLWMQQLGGGSPVQVTKDPEDETDPDISPDGTKIAFRSECKGGGIYVAPALGGEPMLLVPGGRNPRFSPDGQWIAYWAGRETSSYQPGSAGVFLIRAGGGETRQIHSEFAAALYPVWSPRGDSLLVLGRREAKEQLPDDLDWWVLPLDGRPARKSGALPILLADKLGHLIGQYALVPLAWSDAQFGGKVLFAAQRGDAANIWELPLSVKSGQASGRAARVTSGTGVNNSVALASTATGPRLVYSNLNLNFDIWALPLDEESGQARGALQRVTEGTSLDLFPSLSTDGRTLAYLNRRIGVWTLRAKDLQTSKESILVSSSLELTYPKISGDGSKVSYADLDGNVWQVATQGGNAVRLCSQCGSPSDSSADGSGVILEPLDTPEDVRKLDARSMQVTELVSRSGRLLGARLSKDEEWVAFHRIEEGQPNPQIFIAPTRGESASPRSGWIAVTSGQNMDRDPRWSPQGKMLYFLSDRDGFRCLWAQRLEPATKRPLGEPFAVEHFHRARLSMTRLTNRSDAIGVAVGRGRVVLAVGEMTGNLWLQIGEP
jgi:Tol biopolymer transport system component